MLALPLEGKCRFKFVDVPRFSACAHQNLFTNWYLMFISLNKNALYCALTNSLTYGLTFPIFPHISRSKWDILKISTAFVQVSFVLCNTIPWFSKEYPVWRENPKWPPHRLTISDFPSYLENLLRYLKRLNGICLGIVFARWHNSLIFKNISCLAGKFKMAAVQMDHF